MKIAILSLRFAPGHIAHLRAYRELFTALGCEIRMFLDYGYKGYLSETQDVEFVDTINTVISWKPDRVFSYNIANENVKLAMLCKKWDIPFFYVLHEPWDSLWELISLRQRMPRRIAANIINYFTAHYAYRVVLASENGKKKYEQYMKGCNENYTVFPLIFCDDYDRSLKAERKYFSFIGGFTVMRGCNEYLDFIKYSISRNLPIKFCIATRNSVSIKDPTLMKAVQDCSLVIFAGKPMTSDEINGHYRESICSWNAYKSSTQSGVLPNALMQGSPVLVTDRGDSVNAVTEKKEGYFISLPHKNEEIEKAYMYIAAHIEDMSKAAREKFHKDFEFLAYLDKAREVYEIQ